MIYALIRFAEESTEINVNPFEINGFDDFFRVIGVFFEQFNEFVGGIKELLTRIPTFIQIFIGVFVVTFFIMAIVRIVINLL